MLKYIPGRFELPVLQNSIIRVFVYTQQESDCDIYIENESSPYDKPDSYGSFPGSALTAVGDFYNPEPNVFNTSSFGVTADKRNTKEYTEMFGNIAKGNYYIVVRGNTYRFKIILEPLLYNGDAGITNYTKETAAAYTIGNEQEGVLISNGIVNGDFIKTEKSTDSWYKFTADKGKYNLDFYTDGFFQGTASVLDSSGSPVSGIGITAEAFLKFGLSNEVAATYENHVAKAGVFTKSFDLPKNGTYYVNVNKRNWTAGSYK